MIDLKNLQMKLNLKTNCSILFLLFNKIEPILHTYLIIINSLIIK